MTVLQRLEKIIEKGIPELDAGDILMYVQGYIEKEKEQIILAYKIGAINNMSKEELYTFPDVGKYLQSCGEMYYDKL